MIPAPLPRTIGSFLTTLVGKTVRVTKATGDWSKQVFVACELASPDGASAGLLVANVEFTAFSAAALATIPVAVAQDGIRKKKLDEGLMENFHEIANILSGVFQESERVILGKIVPPADLSEGFAALLSKPRVRADFDVELPGYGNGKLGVLLG